MRKLSFAERTLIECADLPGTKLFSVWPARHIGDLGYGSGMYNQNLAIADMNGDGFKEIFGPTTGHYVTALDRNGNQLAANATYNNVSPIGPKVWSQVGVHVGVVAYDLSNTSGARVLWGTGRGSYRRAGRVE